VCPRCDQGGRNGGGTYRLVAICGGWSCIRLCCGGADGFAGEVKDIDVTRKFLGGAELTLTCNEFSSPAFSLSICGSCKTCVKGLVSAALVDMFSFSGRDKDGMTMRYE
jgi:hypothetical protein